MNIIPYPTDVTSYYLLQVLRIVFYQKPKRYISNARFCFST